MCLQSQLLGKLRWEIAWVRAETTSGSGYKLKGSKPLRVFDFTSMYKVVRRRGTDLTKGTYLAFIILSRFEFKPPKYSHDALGLRENFTTLLLKAQFSARKESCWSLLEMHGIKFQPSHKNYGALSEIYAIKFQPTEIKSQIHLLICYAY